MDVSRCPIEAVRTIADNLKGYVTRVLTSGGARSAIEGCDVIKRMVPVAGDCLSVMAGSGVRTEGLSALACAGVRCFHASASVPVLRWRHGDLAGLPAEFRCTDMATVRAMRVCLDKLGAVE